LQHFLLGRVVLRSVKARSHFPPGPRRVFDTDQRADPGGSSAAGDCHGGPLMHRVTSAPAAHSVALGYVLLVLVVGAAYYPSLWQAARADQFVYLYTTRDKADLHSLTIGSYAWDRDIQGDIQFFRPVLFFLLGLERWAFGADHFMAWQAVSLFLHLAVVVLLCHCLRIWHGGRAWLPFIVAGFFGVQYASMEM